MSTASHHIEKRQHGHWHCLLCDEDDAYPGGYSLKKNALFHVRTKHNPSTTTSKRTISAIEVYRHFKATDNTTFKVNQDGLYECADCGPEENPLEFGRVTGWEACTIVSSHASSNMGQLVNITILEEDGSQTPCNDIPVTHIREKIHQNGRVPRARVFYGNDVVPGYTGPEPTQKLNKDYKKNAVEKSECSARDATALHECIAAAIDQRLKSIDTDAEMPAPAELKVLVGKVLDLFEEHGCLNAQTLGQLVDGMLTTKKVYVQTKKIIRKNQLKTDKQRQRRKDKAIKEGVAAIVSNLKQDQVKYAFVHYFSEDACSGRAIQDLLNNASGRETVAERRMKKQTIRHRSCPRLFKCGLPCIDGDGDMTHACNDLKQLFCEIHYSIALSLKHSIDANPSYFVHPFVLNFYNEKKTTHLLVTSKSTYRTITKKIFSYVPMFTTDEGWRDQISVLTSTTTKLVNTLYEKTGRWNVSNGWTIHGGAGKKDSGWKWFGLQDRDALDGVIQPEEPEPEEPEEPEEHKEHKEHEEPTTTTTDIQWHDTIFCNFGVTLNYRSQLIKHLLERAHEDQVIKLADHYFPKPRVRRASNFTIMDTATKNGQYAKRGMDFARGDSRPILRVDGGRGYLEDVYVGNRNIKASPLDGKPMIYMDPVEISLTILRSFYHHRLLKCLSKDDLRQLSINELKELFAKTHPLYWMNEMCVNEGVTHAHCLALAEKHKIDWDDVSKEELVDLVHDVYNTFLLRPYGDCADFVKT